MARRGKTLTKKQTGLLILLTALAVIGLLILGTVLSEDPEIRAIRKGYWVSDGEDVDVLLSFSGSKAELYVFASDSSVVSYIGSCQMQNGWIKITDNSFRGDMTFYELNAEYALNEAGDSLTFVMYGGSDGQQNYTFTLSKTEKSGYKALKRERTA